MTEKRLLDFLLGAMLILSTAPIVAEAKNIEQAFGVSLGHRVDEAILVTEFVRSKRFPGALHAIFRPSRRHPLLNKYGLWITRNTKRVVAIRGMTNIEVNENFRDRPGYSYDDMEDVHRDWGHFYRRLCVQQRDAFNRLQNELKGPYGHLPSTRGKEGKCSAGWYEREALRWVMYEDSATKATLTVELECRRRTSHWREKYHCVVLVLYELDAATEMLVREADNPHGL